MRRVVALVVACVLSSSPLFAATGVRGQVQGSSVSGTATDTDRKQPLAGYTVQLRNLGTGQIVGTTTTSTSGGFTFAGLPAGNYATELVSASGVIGGTSASIAVTAGATVTGVAVWLTASKIIAGAVAGGGISTALIITTVAAAAGIAGLVIAKKNASPSQ